MLAISIHLGPPLRMSLTAGLAVPTPQPEIEEFNANPVTVDSVGC